MEVFLAYEASDGFLMFVYLLPLVVFARADSLGVGVCCRWFGLRSSVIVAEPFQWASTVAADLAAIMAVAFGEAAWLGAVELD